MRGVVPLESSLTFSKTLGIAWAVLFHNFNDSAPLHHPLVSSREQTPLSRVPQQSRIPPPGWSPPAVSPRRPLRSQSPITSFRYSGMSQMPATPVSLYRSPRGPTVTPAPTPAAMATPGFSVNVGKPFCLKAISLLLC